MYLPEHFEQEDMDDLKELVRGHPLGALITEDSNGLTANHVPFEWSAVRGEHGSLVGHVARNNDVWKSPQPKDVLVIFGGPQAYISPNWYPSTHETHQVVPTYNYAVVHVHGTLIVHDNERWLRGVVVKLTRSMEEVQARPWKMADAPQDFLRTQLAQIVGIEIRISRVVGKWKMSQNRSLADQEGAIAGLQAADTSNADEVAEMISENVRSRAPVRPD